MKYLVMECRLSCAVVLDEDGRFLKVANQHYQVGQTVTEVTEMQIPHSSIQKPKTNRWVYTLAIMAACLALAVTALFRMGEMTYASVYMTINPEVRIDVNRRDRVVGLAGVNADGEELIQGYRYRRKDLDLVMDELLDRAIDMGYLHEGGQITLVLDARSNEWIVSHSSTLPAQLDEYLREKLSVTIEVMEQASQSNPVVIPVSPPESNYGLSDYSTTQSTARTTAATIIPAATQSPATPAPPAVTQPPATSASPAATQPPATSTPPAATLSPVTSPPPAATQSVPNADSGYGDNSYDDSQTDYGVPDVTGNSGYGDGGQSNYGEGGSDYDD